MDTRTLLVSFEDLAFREPRLWTLWHTMQQVRDDGTYFCRAEAFEAWTIPSFKRQMATLVGHGAARRESILGTAEAYETAYAALIEALPPCRKCGCL